MRYLGADDLRRALPMSLAIESQCAAFADDKEVPVRMLLGQSMFMPGRVAEHTGMKVVSIVPGNPVGVVAVFDARGTCMGLVDGPTLTAIRTAAGAGLATQLLARPDCSSMAMLGAGAMAFDQVMAVREVRPVDEIYVWSRTSERAKELAERVDGEAIDEADEAVGMADIVTTATPSSTPLFSAEALQPGTHINAVGAFTPEMAEIPPSVVQSSVVVVDDVPAALAEAGDLLQAGVAPTITMADLLEGRVRGRSERDEVTLFKSVGVSSQDVAAAVAALDSAQVLRIGHEL